MRNQKNRFISASGISFLLVAGAVLLLREQAGVTLPTVIGLLALCPFIFFALALENGHLRSKKSENEVFMITARVEYLWIGVWLGSALLLAIPLQTLGERAAFSLMGDGYSPFRFPGIKLGQGIIWELLSSLVSILLLDLILREAGFISGICLRCTVVAIIWAVLQGTLFLIPLYFVLGFAFAYLMIAHRSLQFTMPFLLLCMWRVLRCLYDYWRGVAPTGGYGRWIGMTVIFSGFSLLLAVLSWRKLLKMPHLKGWKLLLFLCTAGVLIISGCAITGFYAN